MKSNEVFTRNQLTICVHYEPSGVDPHVNAAELGLQMTMGVFDTLVYKLPDGTFLPHLAESWEVSSDELSYRFHLRRDVRFHDGTPFNADAVKFSLDRARDPINQSQLAGSMLGPFASAAVVDTYTVEIHLTERYGMLLDALSQGWLAPVSPAAARLLGGDFKRHPVGTGPFIFDEWAPGHHIRLRRNPDYGWAPPVVENRGPAHIDAITFLFLRDGADRTAALESGAADGIFYVDPGDVARLRADSGYTLKTWPIRGAPVCIMLNMSKAPTDDPMVRRAIKCAVDQEAIIKEVFRGEFDWARGPLSHYTLGYTPGVEVYNHPDRAQANQLLDRAGWAERDGSGIRQKDGRPLQLVFYALPVNYYPEFGRLVREQLGQVGIDVEVRLVSAIKWIQDCDASEHHMVPQGKYANGPQILSYIYHSRASEASYGWTKRTADFCPELDGWLEQGEQALAPEQYVPIYQRVQETIMENALIVPLHCNTNIVALKSGISGLEFDAIGAYPLLHDVRIDGVSR